MFGPGKQNHSYKHVSAKTPEALEELMLQIATDLPYVVVFTPPTYSNAKWVSWYVFDWSNVVAKNKVDSEP